MIRTLISISALAFISVATGCAAAPPVETAPLSMRQAAKAQNIRCTAEQKRGCWVEFKCVQGDAKERAGCRATRRECLAACVR
jgi:hypothetical protein